MKKKEIEQKLLQLQNEVNELQTKLGVDVTSIQTEPETPKLEVGKWYKNIYKSLFYVKAIDGDYASGYGFDKGKWLGNLDWYISEIQEATPQEVETALIAEAKKRGFIEGVIYDSLEVEGWECNKNTEITHNVNYSFEENILYSFRGIIFHNGKWAELSKLEPEIDWNKPQLLKSIHTELILLSSGEHRKTDFTGAVIQPNQIYTKGEIITTWEKESFKPFKGKLTLEN